MKHNKKGFTLIEMLVVIAIIAVLVTIITPAISSYTTKANAATNAANLRSIKASVSTMLLNGEITYDTSLLSFADVIYRAEEKAAEALFSGNWQLAALINVGIARLQETGSLQAMNTYTASDEKIDIDGRILSAPSAKSIKVGNLTLREGTEMTVTVGEDDIVVTYGGINIDTFALIAQYGDDTEIDMTTVPHNHTDGNNDGLCDICTKELTLGEKGDSSLNDVLNGGHSCKDEDSNCICDDTKCGQDVHQVYQHNCSKCDKVMSTCDRNSVDNTGHFCSICGGNKASHSNNGSNGCTVNGCTYKYATTSYEATSTCNSDCKNCGKSKHSGNCATGNWVAG